MTVFTVFFFPFQVLDKSSEGNTYIKHQFLGTRNMMYNVTDKFALKAMPEKPFVLNYIAKVMIMTSTFASLYIIFKQQDRKE